MKGSAFLTAGLRSERKKSLLLKAGFSVDFSQFLERFLERIYVRASSHDAAHSLVVDADVSYQCQTRIEHNQTNCSYWSHNAQLSSIVVHGYERVAQNWSAIRRSCCGSAQHIQPGGLVQGEVRYN